MDLLRKSFRDISAGCTAGTVLSKPCFIKHLAYPDQIGFEDRKNEFFEEAKSAGLPTDEEKLKILRKQNLWDDAKERALEQARQQIPSLHEAKKKHMNMPSLVKLYVKQITDAEKDYEDKLLQKRQLLELTCEVFAERCANDHYIISNLFADSQMTHSLFTIDEFDWFRDEMVSSIIGDYNRVMEGCSEKNVKKLAMQPFFQRYFQLAGENFQSFFGKPICSLTNHQIDLLRWGAHFRNIYSSHDVSTWRKEVLDDPDLLTEYSIAVTKGKEDLQNRGGYDENTVVLGAGKEDRQTLGIAQSPNVAREIHEKYGGDYKKYLLAQSSK